MLDVSSLPADKAAREQLKSTLTENETIRLARQADEEKTAAAQKALEAQIESLRQSIKETQASHSSQIAQLEQRAQEELEALKHAHALEVSVAHVAASLKPTTSPPPLTYSVPTLLFQSINTLHSYSIAGQAGKRAGFGARRRCQ